MNELAADASARLVVDKEPPPPPPPQTTRPEPPEARGPLVGQWPQKRVTVLVAIGAIAIWQYILPLR